MEYLKQDLIKWGSIDIPNERLGNTRVCKTSNSVEGTGEFHDEDGT